MATEVVLDCTAPQELTSAHAQETTERALEHGGEAVAPPTPQRTRRTASEVWHSTTETSLSAHLWFHPPPYSVMTAPTLKKKKKNKGRGGGMGEDSDQCDMLPTGAVEDLAWH